MLDSGGQACCACETCPRLAGPRIVPLRPAVGAREEKKRPPGPPSSESATGASEPAARRRPRAPAEPADARATEPRERKCSARDPDAEEPEQPNAERGSNGHRLQALTHHKEQRRRADASTGRPDAPERDHRERSATVDWKNEFAKNVFSEFELLAADKLLQIQSPNCTIAGCRDDCPLKRAIEGDAELKKMAGHLSRLCERNSNFVLQLLMDWRLDRLALHSRLAAREGDLNMFSIFQAEKNRQIGPLSRDVEISCFGVELIFGSALLACLDRSSAPTPHELGADTLYRIERIALPHFDPRLHQHFQRKRADRAAHQQLVLTTYAKITGILSSTRLQNALAWLKGTLSASSAKLKYVACALNAFRYMRPDLLPPAGAKHLVDLTDQLLRACNHHNRALKQTASDLLEKLLRSVFFSPSPQHFGPTWHGWLRETFLQCTLDPPANYKSKNRKHLIGIGTAALCLLRASEFTRLYKNWTDKLSWLIRHSNARRLSALNNTLRVLEAHALITMRLSADPHKKTTDLLQPTTDLLQSTTDSLLHFLDSKFSARETEPTDLLVDAIYAIFRVDPDFAIKQVLLKIMSWSHEYSYSTGFTNNSADIPACYVRHRHSTVNPVIPFRQLNLGRSLKFVHNSFPAHKLIVAFQAVLKIRFPQLPRAQPRNKKRRLFDLPSRELEKLVHRPPRAPPSPPSPPSPPAKLMDSHWCVILNVWTQSILHVDALLDLTCKTPSDLTRLERESTDYQLLKLLFKAIPSVVPSIPTSKLVNMLTKYVVFVDAEISRVALDALFRLVEHAPNSRFCVVYGLCSYSLTLLHKPPQPLALLLSKLDLLVRTWIDVLRSSPDPPAEPSNLNHILRIEGIVLIHLCNPKPSIRSIALQILESIRALQLSLFPDQPDHPHPSPTTLRPGARAASVMETMTPTTLTHVQLSWPFLQRYLPSNPTRHHLITRSVLDDNEDAQLLWSYLLGDLVKHMCEHQPQSTLYAMYIIQSLIEYVEPQDKRHLPHHQLETFYWWRNYAIFQCAALMSNMTSILSPRLVFYSAFISIPMSKRVFLQKETLESILLYLKSDVDCVQDACTMALQRTHHSSAQLLFSCLRTYHDQCAQTDYLDKKRKRKRDRLRLQITSIYAYIIESLEPTASSTFQCLKAPICEFIHESCRFLKENSNLFDLIKLRYQFCIVCDHLMRLLNSSKDRLTPDDLALKHTVYQLLSSWCVDDALQQAIVKKELDRISPKAEKVEERASYARVLTKHITTIKCSALKTMSSCLVGLHAANLSPNDPLLSYLERFLDSDHSEVQCAAELVLTRLLEDVCSLHVLQFILDKCYLQEPQKGLASQYFRCLSDVFPANQKCNDDFQAKLCHLIVYMLGDERIHVRRAVHALLSKLNSVQPTDRLFTSYPFLEKVSFSGDSAKVQLQISTLLADEHPGLAAKMLEELVSRITKLPNQSKSQLLRSIVPWIKKLELHAVPEPVAENAMANLLYVSLECHSDFYYEIKEIWLAVALAAPNVQIVVRELLNLGVIKQNEDIVRLINLVFICMSNGTRVIADVLARELSIAEPYVRHRSSRSSSDCAPVNNGFDPSQPSKGKKNKSYKLIKELSRGEVDYLARKTLSFDVHGTTSAQAKGAPTNDATPTCVLTENVCRNASARKQDPVHPQPGANDLAPSCSVFKSHKFHPFTDFISSKSGGWALSRSYFIFLILSQITHESGEQFLEHLPIIFQFAVVGLDITNPLIYESCQITISNIMHSLLVRRPNPPDSNRRTMTSAQYEQMAKFVEGLQSSHGSPLWEYEDASVDKLEPESAEKLAKFVQAIVEPLTVSQVRPKLVEEWAGLALSWAVRSRCLHITERSFQIYRSLRPAIAREPLNALLDSLIQNARDGISSPDQGHLIRMSEVLVTLRTLVKNNAQSDLLPEIFWCSVAMLRTDLTQHYSCSLRLMDEILCAAAADEKRQSEIVYGTGSVDRSRFFDDVQVLVFKGLFSPELRDVAAEVLSKLACVPYRGYSADEPGRVCRSIVALLPFIGSNMYPPSPADHSPTKPKCIEIIKRLERVCRLCALSKLKRVFRDLSDGRYKSLRVFVHHLKAPLNEAMDQAVDTTNSTSTSSGERPDNPKDPKPATEPVDLSKSYYMLPEICSLDQRPESPRDPYQNEAEAPHEQAYQKQPPNAPYSETEKHPVFNDAITLLFTMLKREPVAWEKPTLLLINAVLRHQLSVRSSPAEDSKRNKPVQLALELMCQSHLSVLLKISSRSPLALGILNFALDSLPPIDSKVTPFDTHARSSMCSLLKPLHSDEKKVNLAEVLDALESVLYIKQNTITSSTLHRDHKGPRYKSPQDHPYEEQLYNPDNQEVRDLKPTRQEEPLKPQIPLPASLVFPTFKEVESIIEELDELPLSGHSVSDT